MPVVPPVVPPGVPPVVPVVDGGTGVPGAVVDNVSLKYAGGLLGYYGGGPVRYYGGGPMGHGGIVGMRDDQILARLGGGVVPMYYGG